jgi:hypothetical protein
MIISAVLRYSRLARNYWWNSLIRRYELEIPGESYRLRHGDSAKEEFVNFR